VAAQPTGTPKPTTPSTAPAKTLSGGFTLWTIKSGVIFQPPTDPRTAARYMTLQVSLSRARPSNSQPIPSRPTYADGILAWSPTGTVTRSGLQPRWIRVGNRSGKWTGWVALRR